MTPLQLAVVAAASVATLLTRFLPFIVFRNGEVPQVIRYLGKALPGAVFGFLVVYCLKDVQWLSGAHGVPEALGVLVAGGLYLWRKNMLLSIFAATGLYMVLVNLVFV